MVKSSRGQMRPIPTEDFDDEYDEDYEDNPRAAVLEELTEEPTRNPMFKDEKMAPMQIETGSRPSTRQSCWERNPKTSLLCFAGAVALITALTTGVLLKNPPENPFKTKTESTLLDFQNYSAIGTMEHSENLIIGFGTVEKREEPLMEATWETRIDNGYPNVILTDDGKYRLLYGDCEGDGESPCASQVLLYAESDDGLSWTKPETGLFPNAPKDLTGAEEPSNVVAVAKNVGVLERDGQHWLLGELCTSQDIQVGCSSKKMKNIARLIPFPLDKAEYGVFYMDKTIHKLPSWDAAPKHRWDTHNAMVWDPIRKLYIATTRLKGGELIGRTIGIATAEKKLKRFWEEPWQKNVDPILQPTIPTTVLKGSQSKQYYAMVPFIWKDVILGLVAEYHPEINGTVEEATISCRLAFATKPRPTDVNENSKWTVIESSLLNPDETDFIPFGDTFDSDVCFAAKPVYPDGADDARIYYFGGDALHSDPDRQTALGLATIDPDRFAGVKSKDPTAQLKTKYVKIAGDTLTLTFDNLLADSCLSIIHVENRKSKKRVVEVDPNPDPWTFCDMGPQTNVHLTQLDLSRTIGQELRITFQLGSDTILYGFAFVNVTTDGGDGGHD